MASIGVVDALIVLLIVVGGIIGFKHGAIREGMQFIGLIVALIVAFMLKDDLMVLMYENLPFYKFFGVILELDALNILFYQLVAFLVIFLALTFILRVLIVVTGLIEWLLKITVFFSAPSKIIGIFIGMLEFYVYIFVVLYVLNMPIFNLTYVNDSNIGTAILENTPVLSGLVDDTVDVYMDVFDIIKNRGEKSSKTVNAEVLEKLLEHNLISAGSARKLVDANKIIVDDDVVVDRYMNGDPTKVIMMRRDASNVGDYFESNNVGIKLTSIGDECITTGTCDTLSEIEVGVTVTVNGTSNNYTLATNKGYTQVGDEDVYVFALIKSGELVLGYAV